MPGRDGTGPEGKGSRTGRGAGNCAGYDVTGAEEETFWPGRGFGRGAFGCGRGRRHWFRAARMHRWAHSFHVGWGGPELNKEQEAEILKHRASRLHGALDSINKRLEELSSEE